MKCNEEDYIYKLIVLCGEHEERSNAKSNESMFSLGRELDLSVFAVFEEINEDDIEICIRRGWEPVSSEVHMKKHSRQHSDFKLHYTEKEEMPELASIDPDRTIDFYVFDRIIFYVDSILKFFKKKKDFNIEM